MQKDATTLIRFNIQKLIPYSSARHDFTGEASVFLDANENSYGSPLPVNYNRYPDPFQYDLKVALSTIKGIPTENIFLGNGSDEVIDLAFRIFCNPGVDNVIICPPTYGMYEVSANINDVTTRKVPLTADFQLDVISILQASDQNTKMLFICSPNNPTGNNMRGADVETLLNMFPGIILIDEAYINFSRQKSFLQKLTEYPNLIVMQTLSKAWGLAALRLGLCFASESLIQVFNKVKPPYNINNSTQQLCLAALKNISQVNMWIDEIVQERITLGLKLSTFHFVKIVYPTDANFILVKVTNADRLYQYLAGEKIIVRNRSKEPGCFNCLRMTIGTPEQNKMLIEVLSKYEQQ